MQAHAVIIEAPERLSLRPLDLLPLQSGDVLVEIAWSGISTGTEKLLWSGAMPPSSMWKAVAARARSTPRSPSDSGMG